MAIGEIKVNIGSQIVNQVIENAIAQADEQIDNILNSNDRDEVKELQLLFSKVLGSRLLVRISLDEIKKKESLPSEILSMIFETINNDLSDLLERATK